MIPQRNLSLLSNRLARDGGRRVPEAVLERDYCLAWFLIGLSRSPLRERLAFKGGTAIKRCYFGDYRFSEDLDFTLIAEAPFETIQEEGTTVQEVMAGSPIPTDAAAPRIRRGIPSGAAQPASGRPVAVTLACQERGAAAWPPSRGDGS